MQRERALRQREADGVDEKGHVVIDHLDDGMRRAVAVVPRRGVEHPHQGAAAAPMRHSKMGEGDDRQFARIPSGQIDGLDVAVVCAQVLPQMRPPQGAAQRSGKTGRRRGERGNGAMILIRRRWMHEGHSPRSNLVFLGPQ